MTAGGHDRDRDREGFARLACLRCRLRYAGLDDRATSRPSLDKHPVDEAFSTPPYRE